MRGCVCGGSAVLSEGLFESEEGDPCNYKQFFAECSKCWRSFSGCATSDSLLEIDVARTLVMSSWNSFQERLNG